MGETDKEMGERERIVAYRMHNSTSSPVISQYNFLPLRTSSRGQAQHTHTNTGHKFGIVGETETLDAQIRQLLDNQRRSPITNSALSHLYIQFLSFLFILLKKHIVQPSSARIFDIGREDAEIVRNEIIRVEWASLPISFDAPSNSKTRPRRASPHSSLSDDGYLFFFNYVNSQRIKK